MSWTYNLHGRPETPTGVMSVIRDEAPGHLLVIERQDDPGVCDGYMIRHQNHDTHTASYDWVGCGTPGLVMPMVINRLIEKQ